MQSTNMFKSASHNPQLLLLDQKSAKCLLETYVKRTLSLNEGCKKHQQFSRVNWDEGGSQTSRASSDISTHRLERHLKINKCTECTTSASESLKGSSKTKRRSLFRGNLFSKKKSDLKLNGDGVSDPDCMRISVEEDQEVDTSYESSPDHTKNLRKKTSLKDILFSNQNVEQRESLLTDSSRAPVGEEELSDGES